MKKKAYEATHPHNERQNKKLPHLLKGQHGRRKSKGIKDWPFSKLRELDQVQPTPNTHLRKTPNRRSLNNVLTPLEQVEAYVKPCPRCPEEETRRYEQQQQQQQQRPNFESQFAARIIQKRWRGYWCRCRFYAPDGILAHHYALVIQKGVRGRLGRVRAHTLRKLRDLERMVCVQNWLRRRLKYFAQQETRALELIRAMTRFQAQVRGAWGRRRARKVRLEFHHKMARRIQGFTRRASSRKLATYLKQLREKEVEHLHRVRTIHHVLIHESGHRPRSDRIKATTRPGAERCGRCHPRTCTERSLVDCIMGCLLGLFDLPQVRTMIYDGISKFPQSAVLYLLSAVVSTLSNDVVAADRASRYAKDILALDTSPWIKTNELENRYFCLALLLWPKDASILLSYGVFLYTLNSENLPRVRSLFDRCLASCRDMPHYVRNYLIRTCERTRRHVEQGPPRELLLTPKGMQHTLISGLELRAVQFQHHICISTTSTSPIQALPLILDPQELALLSREIQRGYCVLGQDLNPRQMLMLGSDNSKLARSIDEKISVNNEEDRHHHQDNVPVVLRVNSPLVKAILNCVHVIPTTTLHSSSRSHITKAKMIVPIIAKRRTHQALLHSRHESVVAIQRHVRGYVVRAKSLATQQRQVWTQVQLTTLERRLGRQSQRRQQRAQAATAFQRLFRGQRCRLDLLDAQARARVVQRFWRRRYRCQSPEAQLKNVNATTTCVYHRGVEISGHKMILDIIKASGSSSSFAFIGHDLQTCNRYRGTFPALQLPALLTRARGLAAADMVGRSFIHTNTGRQGTIVQVIANHPMSNLRCDLLLDPRSGKSTTTVELTCEEAVTGIRVLMRRMTTTKLKSTESEKKDLYPMPVQRHETNRVVDLLVSWMTLVPSVNAPTAELKARESDQVLVIVFPPMGNHHARRCPLWRESMIRPRVHLNLKHTREQRRVVGHPSQRKTTKSLMTTTLRCTSALKPKD